MYSLEEGLGEDHIEEGGDRSYRGQYKGEYQNRGGQPGPARDPNAMEVDRRKGGDRTYFVYRK